MYYIVESSKSFEQAATDLETAVKRKEFGVIKPVPMLAALSQDQTLVKVAQEAEARTKKMIEESR